MRLLALWKALMEMEPELRKGADARLLLEVTLLSSMPGQTVRGVVAAAQSEPPAELVAGVRPVADDADVDLLSEPLPAAADVGGNGRWEALKQKLPKPVASLLTDARLASAREGVVRIEFRYPAHADLMGTARNRETLLTAVREIYGAEMRVELSTEPKKPAAGAAPAGSGVATPAATRGPASIVDDPLVKEAMNRFDATNVRVTPRGRS
jgi:hypothetical protein